MALRPWWCTLPSQRTPVSDGAPEASQFGMFRSSVPAPLPSRQSVTIAPVWNGGVDRLPRTRHGSGVPRGLSSSGLGVPRSLKERLMSNMIRAAPLPQVSLSLAYTSSSWQA